MSGLAVDLRGKSYGGQLVLGEIAFSVAPGERVALLGPSGIGKSTLLGLIAGTVADFDGRIERPDGPVAMIFQQPRLLPWRTLAENIALVPGAGDLARAHELLAEVGLGPAADQHPEKVSLGMQRRAALARALAIDPVLMLMDEPLVSLDAETGAGMRRLLVAALDRTGAMGLIATHDRREALAIADRVLELGGTPARLISDRTSPLDRTGRADPAAIEGLHAEWFGEASR